MDAETKEQIEVLSIQLNSTQAWLLEIMDLCNEQTHWLEEIEDKLNILISKE